MGTLHECSYLGYVGCLHGPSGPVQSEHLVAQGLMIQVWCGFLYITVNHFMESAACHLKLCPHSMLKCDLITDYI